MNAGLMAIRQQTSRQRYNKMENPTIGVTKQGTIATIVKRMDMFLRISLVRISDTTTIDGWVRLQSLVVSRLVMSAETIELGHWHRVMETIKANKRSMLRR